MKTEIVKKEVAKTSQWAGGETTELYIYPEGSDFKKRDFIFRISTATVRIETSVFTSLPGVMRTLMVLEGELLLEHEEQYSKKLKPFDCDHFKGEWLTKSYGTATDFNVMTTRGVKSETHTIKLTLGESQSISLKGDVSLFYVCRGKVNCNDSVVALGDILLVTSYSDHESFLLTASQETILIAVSIANLPVN